MKFSMRKAVFFLFVLCTLCLGLALVTGAAGNEASVNGTEYATLTEALNAAGNGDTVTLLGDVTLPAKVTVSKSITIDGKNHTITAGSIAAADYLFTTADGAAFSLKDVTVTHAKAHILRVEAGTSATLEPGTHLIGQQGDIVVYIVKTSTVTMKNGSEVSGTNTSGQARTVVNYGILHCYGKITTTVNYNGENSVITNYGGSSDTGTATNIYEGAELSINNANATQTKTYVIWTFAPVNIFGGKLESTGGVLKLNRYSNAVKANVQITGGELIAGSGSANNTGVIYIEGSGITVTVKGSAHIKHSGTAGNRAGIWVLGTGATINLGENATIEGRYGLFINAAGTKTSPTTLNMTGGNLYSCVGGGSVMQVQKENTTDSDGTVTTYDLYLNLNISGGNFGPDGKLNVNGINFGTSNKTVLNLDISGGVFTSVNTVFCNAAGKEVHVKLSGDAVLHDGGRPASNDAVFKLSGANTTFTLEMSGGHIDAGNYGIYLTGKESKADITVTGGTITGSNGGIYVNSTDGELKLHISDGTLETDTADKNVIDLQNAKKAEITLSGGEIKAANICINAVSADCQTDITVTGGTMDGANGCIYVNNATASLNLLITDVHMQTSNTNKNNIYVQAASTADITIEGGTYSATKFCLWVARGSGCTANVKISGGTYTGGDSCLRVSGIGSTAVITGGVFRTIGDGTEENPTPTIGDSVVEISCDAGYSNCVMSIYGGAFYGGRSVVARAWYDATLNVYGGTFVFELLNGIKTSTDRNVIRAGAGNTNGTVHVYGGYFESNNTSGALIYAIYAGCTATVGGGVFAGGLCPVNTDKSTTGLSTASVAYPNGVTRMVLNGVELQKGASVRLDPESSGIRFTSELSPEAVAYLQGLADTGSLAFGTLIVPTDYLTGLSAFTMAELQRAGHKYLDIAAIDGLTVRADGGYTIRAAMIDIKAQNIERRFSAVSYAKFTVNGEEVYFYADYSETASSRSIYIVAKLALSDISATRTGKYIYPVEDGYSPYSPEQRAVLASYYGGQIGDPYVLFDRQNTAAGDVSCMETQKLFDIYSFIKTSYSRNNAMQGACTDGQYAYFCMLDVNNAYPDETKFETVIVKVDLATNRAVSCSARLPLGHANDMCYNSKTGQLVIAYNASGSATDKVCLVNAGTLAFEGERELTVKIYGIAYDRDSSRYITAASGKKLTVLDENFAVVESKSITGMAVPGYTTGKDLLAQGIDADSKYVYFVFSGYGEVDANGNPVTWKNYILAFDYEGNHQFTRELLGMTEEIENMFHIGTAIYVSCNGANEPCYCVTAA